MRRSLILNTEVIDLSEEEITFISGGAAIDPSEISTTAAVLYPEVDNNPPG